MNDSIDQQPVNAQQPANAQQQQFVQEQRLQDSGRCSIQEQISEAIARQVYLAVAQVAPQCQQANTPTRPRFTDGSADILERMLQGMHSL